MCSSAPSPGAEPRDRGRPRDLGIDERVLEAARRQLAERGYEALSVAGVALEARTSRQALYRRWSTKADLATAAIAAMATATSPAPTGAPLVDLVAELDAFRRGISRPDGLSMVGTMLVRGTDGELVRLFRERVVSPRRARLRAILEGALAAGSIDAEADIDLAVHMLTGSWYARALGGEPPARHWAERTAALVWRALGGDVDAAAVRTGK